MQESLVLIRSGKNPCGSCKAHVGEKLTNRRTRDVFRKCERDDCTAWAQRSSDGEII